MKVFMPIHSVHSKNVTVELDIDTALNGVLESAGKALDDSVHEIFLISTETYCPVDTGDLKGSAQDEVVTDTDTEKTREISYDTEYAKIVHEVPYNHSNPPMAQWKYLEVALRLNETKLVENITSAARDAI